MDDASLFWIGLCVVVLVFIIAMGNSAGDDHFGGF